MKKLVFTLISTFIIIGMASAQHVEGDNGKTYYDDAKTKLKEVFNYKEVNVFSATGNQQVTEIKKKKHGPYFYYYENGKVKISGNYKNDEKHGTWKYYDEKGRMIKEENYIEGQLKS